jgi:hypothetical protein
MSTLNRRAIIKVTGGFVAGALMGSEALAATPTPKLKLKPDKGAYVIPEEYHAIFNPDNVMVVRRDPTFDVPRCNVFFNDGSQVQVKSSADSVGADFGLVKFDELTDSGTNTIYIDGAWVSILRPDSQNTRTNVYLSNGNQLQVQQTLGQVVQTLGADLIQFSEVIGANLSRPA